MSIKPLGFSDLQTSGQESVQMKHRLLYIEIRIHCLFNECLQKADKATMTDGLRRGAKIYQQIDKQLNHSFADRDYHNIDQILETQLVDLYQSRIQILIQLESLLKQMGTRRLQSSLREILFLLDRLICVINGNGDANANQLKEWEDKVDQFQTKYLIRLDKWKLKALWKSDHSKVFQKAEILALYLLWEELLKKESQTLLRQLPHLYKIHAAIKIKKLLQTDKELFFHHYIRDKKTKLLAIKLCVHSLQKKPDKMIAALISEIGKVKTRILACEKNLISKIDRLSHIVSAVARLLTDTPYFRKADFLIESQEKMSREWHNMSALSAPLSASFSNLSKVITGAGLLVLDLMQWRWVGVSQQMLQTFRHTCTPSTDSWITCFQKFGYDEKTALQSLPIIETISEYTIFVAVTSYFVGFSASTLWQTSLSYSLGLAAVTLAGKTVDVIYRFAHDDPTASSTYPFIHGMSQLLAFPLASTYLLPYFLNSSISHSGPIFVNQKACQADQKVCIKEACKMLGVSETASAREIKNAYRQLAIQYHPDHHHHSGNHMSLLSAAKDVCLNKNS